jgi:hypothetical protein
MLSLISPFEEPTAPKNFKNFQLMVAATRRAHFLMLRVRQGRELDF